MGIICLLVEIGLTDLTKSGGAGTTGLKNMWSLLCFCFFKPSEEFRYCLSGNIQDVCKSETDVCCNCYHLRTRHFFNVLFTVTHYCQYNPLNSSIKSKRKQTKFSDFTDLQKKLIIEFQRELIPFHHE